MKWFIFVVSNILLLVPLSVDAQGYQPNWPSYWPAYVQPMVFPGHEDWLSCQADDQCKMIAVRVLTCGVLFTANKDYSDQAYKFVSERVSKAGCNMQPTYPSNTAAKCVDNRCALAIPQQKNVFR
jgi:hypothetical protein